MSEAVEMSSGGATTARRAAVETVVTESMRQELNTAMGTLELASPDCSDPPSPRGGARSSGEHQPRQLPAGGQQNGGAGSRGGQEQNMVHQSPAQTRSQPEVEPQPDQPAPGACPGQAARSVYLSIAESLAGRKHAREEDARQAAIDKGATTPPRRQSCEGDRGAQRVAKKLAPNSNMDLAGVEAVDIHASGALDEYRFNMFMRDLMAEKKTDILCCKGVLNMQGYGDQKFVFKGAHEAICYGPAEQPWKPDEMRISHVVFIGRGLDREALKEGLSSCLWKPPPPGWEKIRDVNTKLSFYVNKKTGEKTWVRPEAPA
ncbi:hypothetical protein HYH02_003892 [Chlamydomonas schloesseri]|uniref:WW domain-containing protein n=1 Tax=Chlamydomonas schloesseri TaxID=2026947 RepID=A0A835WPM2_9CHLO|nr:hypothetical protein HYH02_003892 [Chlamydomonas schloesseri]|eukprot:KAG2451286.1 hypothetical protein HYH02_003892 [Chlamydomonas schloesseri]